MRPDTLASQQPIDNIIHNARASVGSAIQLVKLRGGAEV